MPSPGFGGHRFRRNNRTPAVPHRNAGDNKDFRKQVVDNNIAIGLHLTRHQEQRRMDRMDVQHNVLAGFLPPLRDQRFIFLLGQRALPKHHATF